MDKHATTSLTHKCAFVIDTSKLTRIVEVLRARYERLSLEAKITFTVTLADSRVMSFTDYAEVLALDNRVRNPVRSLHIAVTSSKNEDGLNLICQVDLNGTRDNSVTLDVEANDSRVANEAFADLEEQLDRVRSRAWVANRQNSPIYTLFLTCGIFTAIVTLVLLGRITSPVSAPPMADLAVQANKASTLDEKVDVLFQAERVRMSKTFEEQSDFRKLLTSRTIALVTPLFIGLACLIYIPACYPRAVFAWGDYGEHYKTLESRRNVLWWVVIVALVINIVAGFFVGALQR